MANFLKELQYLPKKYAIMQTSALGSLLSGKAALVGAYATKELNHALAGESNARAFGIGVDNKENWLIGIGSVVRMIKIFNILNEIVVLVVYMI